MNYRKLLLTLLLQVLVLAGYFLLIRPLRAWYGRLHLELIFQRAAEWPKYLNDITLDGITLNFYFQNGGKDRKSTRLNSSHVANSYAVFCLKKKIKMIIKKNKN